MNPIQLIIDHPPLGLPVELTGTPDLARALNPVELARTVMAIYPDIGQILGILGLPVG